MSVDPRLLLTKVFEAAVAAALPEYGIAAHLPEPPRGRTVVVGAGKGSAQMAAAFEKLWPGPLEGLVVTRYGYAAPCRRIDIVDIDEDTIFLGAEHGLTTGQKVKYHHGDGGSDIDGLDDGSEYWVHDAGGGKVKLYDNETNAKAGGDTGRVDLTNDGSGSDHSFGTFINVPLVGEIENPFGGKVKFDPDPNSMRVIELGANHGLRTGDAVVYHRGADVGEIGNLHGGKANHISHFQRNDQAPNPNDQGSWG